MHSRSQVPVLRPFFSNLMLLVLFAACPAGQMLRAQSCANPVACENQLPGDTNWQISGSGASDIQGFATDISVNVGEVIFFKINTTAASYHLDIYRMGYYGGAGARKVATVNPSVSLPQSQPACLTDTTTHLIDCGNWAISASWTVPATATSGIYFAHVIRPDNGDDSQIFWIVRNDSSHADILFQTSDQTWAAYNDYGGHSLYGGAGTFDLNNRAFKVSYNRPYDTRNFEAATFVFNAEYPMVRWLESNGYDVSYFTGVDAVRNASLITNHKLYLGVGHDEYVSAQARANIQAARDAGVNLGYFSGNEVFWKTRWENSIDGANTPYRTMVCYKETYYATGTLYQKDPLDPPTWTGTWADSRFSPPADGGQPQNAVAGTLFAVNGPGPDNSNLSIQVTAADGQMRFWRNTSIATLGAGQTATLPAGTLGYEWDADIDNGFRPAGAVPLSTSTYTLTQDLLLDFGATYGAGNATHHLLLYRAASGALVFGAGTVQWSWGLDSNHDGGGGGADVRMQQATVNLFADMGVQPTTLQTGLIPATKSTDTTPPTAVIASPSAGSSVSYGRPTTITGTAADNGGGVVGAVEVSVDGGQTWHPATGRSQWSYNWSPWALSGSATVMARAVDDSGNIQNPPTSISFNVTGEPTCPCSIWSNSTVPGTPTTTDTSSVELGVKFRSDVGGYVTGVRFYKGTNNTGTHIGDLWTAQGTRLATVTFTNETASGWQQANFSSPVLILANTTYVISYYAPNGGYADDEPYFMGSIDSPPLHAPADEGAGGNGVFIYASGGGFPVATFNMGNYWVDLVFVPSTPWSISGTISGGAGATVTLSGPTNATTAADSSGNYAFAGVLNGTYAVTPSEPDFSFTPSTQNITVNSASVSGVNFTASVLPTYTLSGTISGLGGATISLSGSASATTTANSSGNYSFTVPNGTYTITPSMNGYVFSPPNQTVTVASANVTGVNFTPIQVFSIWSNSATPGTQSADDASPVELGVKFQSSVAGSVIGVRFYKGSINTGTHVGNLWTSSGANLARVTFTNETATGWQQAIFTSPVSITPNTTYIVSYYAPNGGYAADLNFFATSGVNNPPLQALANGVSADGVYLYSSASGFPINTYQSTNYWVDVVFTPTVTYSISGTITGGAGATVTLTGTVTSTVTADSSGNYTFPNLGNGSYTVTPSGSGLVFTPANASVTVSNANITGVNFTASAAPTYSISGTITGGAGATVTLSGAASATVTADSSGNYSFPGLVNGNYTVAPNNSGYTFSPANAAVTINGANVIGVNFTARLALSIDVKIFKDQATASTTVVSPSFSTTSPNELLLAFISADQISQSATTVTNVTGAGLTWTLVLRTNKQGGTAEIWRAFSTAQLNNTSVSATISQKVVSSMTVMSFKNVDTSGTNGSGAIGATGAGNASSGAPTASLVTTRNYSWVFGVGNDFDKAVTRTPGSGQTVIHQYLTPTGDTYWVQMQNNTTPVAGTTVRINDTAPTGDSYNLSICEVRPTP